VRTSILAVNIEKEAGLLINRIGNVLGEAARRFKAGIEVEVDNNNNNNLIIIIIIIQP